MSFFRRIKTEYFEQLYAVSGVFVQSVRHLCIFSKWQSVPACDVRALQIVLFKFAKLEQRAWQLYAT